MGNARLDEAQTEIKCVGRTISNLRCGGGNGTPLQYFCLENPMDRGAWRATVHGVTESDMTQHTHICHEVMGPDAIMLVFLNAEF